MNTNDLIRMLSTNLEPIKTGQVARSLAWAVVVGGAAAFCAMLTTVWFRTEPGNASHVGFLAVKLLFTLSLIGWGAMLLVRLAHPGQAGGRLFALTLLSFLVMGLAGAVAVALQPPTAWSTMILGMNGIASILYIPLFAVIPFASLVFVLRKGAPTALKRTGAVAGLVAGALGATAYAFHCSDDSIPFIALWYGATIALCALIGAVLGPWLLRW